MQASTALSTRFLKHIDEYNGSGYTKFDQKGLLDPASDTQIRTAELVAFVKNYRSSCIGAFRFRDYIAGNLVPALVRMRKTFAAAVRRRSRTEDIIASQYEGRSWCDTTEREMINDIANWGCTRFKS